MYYVDLIIKFFMSFGFFLYLKLGLKRVNLVIWGILIDYSFRYFFLFEIFNCIYTYIDYMYIYIYVIRLFFLLYCVICVIKYFR